MSTPIVEKESGDKELGEKVSGSQVDTPTDQTPNDGNGIDEPKKKREFKDFGHDEEKPTRELTASVLLGLVTHTALLLQMPV